MNSSNERYLNDVAAFISCLQDFLAADDRDGLLFESVLHRAHGLRDHEEVGAYSFGPVLGDVVALLERHEGRRGIDDPLEKSLLRLAADWSVQLLALCREGLPEPRSLVLELRHLFRLVQCSHDASQCAADHPFSELSDPFGDDPAPDAMERNDDTFFDPFSEDPGISSELDRLQKTITHVKSALLLRRPARDAFPDDPAGALPSDLMGKGGGGPFLNNAEEGDMFSDDPDF